MERFVARQNIDRCRARPETETEPTKRTFLLKLLVDEENKLGLDYELLVDVEREIANGHARINRQQIIIGQLDGDGESSAAAKSPAGHIHSDTAHL
jgi:hypothetical protein